MHCKALPGGQLATEKNEGDVSSMGRLMRQAPSLTTPHVRTAWRGSRGTSHTAPGAHPIMPGYRQYGCPGGSCTWVSPKHPCATTRQVAAPVIASIRILIDLTCPYVSGSGEGGVVSAFQRQIPSKLVQKLASRDTGADGLKHTCINVMRTKLFSFFNDFVYYISQSEIFVGSFQRPT
jgi:hypothetical protein